MFYDIRGISKSDVNDYIDQYIYTLEILKWDKIYNLIVYNNV